MRKFIPINLIGLFIVLISLSFSRQQYNSKIEDQEISIIETFNQFFEREIMRQGVKGNWIFKLNEITGIHKFDFNKDGHMDSFFEFNAVPEEGGGVTYYFGVLFENNGKGAHEFVDYLKYDAWSFGRYENGEFHFIKKDQNGAIMEAFIFYIETDKFEQLKRSPN